MAFTLAELIVKIRGDDAALVRTLNGVQGRLNRIQMPTLALAGGIAGGLVGGVAGLEKILEASMDLETRMLKVAKATDLSKDQFEALKNELTQLAGRMKGVSVESLTTFAEQGAKLGVASGDLIRFAEAMGRVSVAADDMDPRELAESLGKIAAVMGMSMTRGIEQLGSAIDKVADSGISSMKGIIEVTQRISGVAKSAHLSAEETIALSAALLDTGAKVDSAGGTLTRFLDKIYKVENHADFAKAMGISADDFAKTLRQKPMEAIKGFLAAIGKLDKTRQGELLDSVGIKDTRDRSNLPKLAEVMQRIPQYVGMAQEEFKTLNQLAKSFALAAEGLAATLEPLFNRMKAGALHVGETLRPLIDQILNGFDPAAAAMTASFDNIVVGTKRFAAAMTELPPLIDRTFGTELAGNIENNAINAFRQLGIATRNLPDFIEIFALKAGEAFSNIGARVSALGENFSIIGTWIGNNWTRIFVDLGTAIGRVFLNLTDNLFNFTEAVLNWADDPFGGFKAPDWKPLFDGMVITAEALPELVSGPLIDVGDAIEQKIREIQGREDEFLRRKKPAPFDNGPAKPNGFANNIAEEAEAGITVKARMEKTDLVGFYDSLSKGIFGDGKDAKRTADGIQQMLPLVQKIAGNAPQKNGPGWAT